MTLVTADSTARIFGPRPSMVYVFWASWSPLSLDAIKAITGSLKKAPVQWVVVPVNVDADRSLPRDTGVLSALLRDIGYDDTLWFDPGLATFSRFGVVAVPTVVVTGLAGQVELAVRGWSLPARERVLGFMGVSEQTAKSPGLDSMKNRCRTRLARIRKQGSRDNRLSASRELARITFDCPDWNEPRLILASWCRIAGDTACARWASELSLAVDSLDPWALTARAAAYHLEGSYEEALLLSRRAVESDSSFTPAWSLLARAALELEDTALAVRCRQAIAGLNRHDPAFHAVSALLAEARGVPSEAVAHWRRAVESAQRRPLP